MFVITIPGDRIDELIFCKSFTVENDELTINQFKEPIHKYLDTAIQVQTVPDVLTFISKYNES
jgi:hypothetical protein